MINTVGIPRALLYYHYAPMLHAFFRTLGVQMIVSPPTTRDMLEQGAARVVTDMCMPVKLYCGHVLALMDKVDRIFVPAIHRLRPGTRNCPKLVGLPDLISAAIPEAPLLTVDVDTESRLQALSQLVQVLRKHFTINPLLVKKATDQAQADQNAYHKLLLQGVPLPEAITLSPLPTRLSQPRPLTVAVIGHPYNLHDEYVTHRLFHRLQKRSSQFYPPVETYPKFV